MVRLKNLSDQPYKGMYAGTNYQMGPGDTLLVPWAAAKLWLGDPYVIDKPTLSQFDRQDEVERMYCRLGAYDGDGSSAGEKFEQNRPQVQVETLDGDLIVMLIDDLDGTRNAQMVGGERPDERVALAAELERMKQIQAELMARLKAVEAGQEEFDDLPTDVPTKIPVDQE